MKKFLSSYFGFWISFLGFFLCCFNLVCDMSVTFGYYSQTYLNYYKYDFFDIRALYTIFFAPLLIMLYLSIMLLIKTGKIKLWDKYKVNLWVLLAVCIAFEIFFTYVVYRGLGFFSILVVPFFAYCVGVVFLYRVVYYYVCENKGKDSIWIRFYKQFPIKSPIGIIVSGLIFACIIYLWMYYFIAMNLTPIWTFFVSMLVVLLIKHISDFAENNEAKLETMVADKVKAERLKTELITNVSHDIKTPLTSIINYTDIIASQDLSSEQIKEYMQVISGKSLRLKDLIEDLIEASKAGTGNISINFESINLCEIIGQIAGEYDEQMKRKNLELVLGVPQHDMFIKADGRHLWRVLENVLSNSIKYSLKGTRVYVDLKESDGEYIFTIKNVSKEPLNISGEELSEQFVRGDRSRNTEGSGLGLYIAKSLVEAMGGRLNIHINGDLFEAEIALKQVVE